MSVATGSSGNYNNACTATNSLMGSPFLLAGALNGSEFSLTSSGFSATLDVDANAFNQICNNFGIDRLDIIPAGYLRWLGGGSPTFAWSLQIGQTSLSNSNTASIVGTASTSQDATSGMGEVLRIQCQTVGKTINTPASNDTVIFAVRGQSTLNGVVSTAKVEITVNFV